MEAADGKDDSETHQFKLNENDFPNEVDLLVIGTGFEESVIAAAASRIGKTVLHIDPNHFYSSSWSTLSLDHYDQILSICCETFYPPPPLPPTAIETIKILENLCLIKNTKKTWHIGNGSTWTKEDINKEYRKINIDLVPKILYSRGKLVDLLISSNISRYAEFRLIDNICTIFDGKIQSVPCSRTDVFNTKDLTIIEKRLLMKLLAQCLSYKKHPEEFKDFEDKTFLEFLKSNRLTDKIIHCMLEAISMCNGNVPFKVGMKRARKFVNSLGRYGNTPFLYPMYGSGEIPQCFCRLCAVYGGVYCLRRPIEIIQLGSNDEKSIIRCDKQDIKVDQIIIGSACIPKDIIKKLKEQSEANSGDELNNRVRCGGMSRAMFICTSPMGGPEICKGGGGVNVLRIPGDDNSNGALVIHLSHQSCTCPKELYIVHITAESQSDNPEMDLQPYMDKILALEDPINIIYSSYFQIAECKGCVADKKLGSDKVHLTCGPFFEIDYNSSIQNVKKIFTKIYPNEEFLPRAPNPNEIIFGDEDPTAIREETIVQEINETIHELGTSVVDQVKCIEENAQNEDKDQSQESNPDKEQIIE